MQFLILKTIKETYFGPNNHHTIKIGAHNINFEEYYENVKKQYLHTSYCDKDLSFLLKITWMLNNFNYLKSSLCNITLPIINSRA